MATHDQRPVVGATIRRFLSLMGLGMGFAMGLIVRFMKQCPNPIQSSYITFAHRLRRNWYEQPLFALDVGIPRIFVLAVVGIVMIEPQNYGNLLIGTNTIRIFDTVDACGATDIQITTCSCAQSGHELRGCDPQKVLPHVRLICHQFLELKQQKHRKAAQTLMRSKSSGPKWQTQATAEGNKRAHKNGTANLHPHPRKGGGYTHPKPTRWPYTLVDTVWSIAQVALIVARHIKRFLQKCCIYLRGENNTFDCLRAWCHSVCCWGRIPTKGPTNQRPG